MECSNPYDLELVKVDTEHDEYYWHKLLKGCFHKGEWYIWKHVCEIVDLT